MDRTSQTLFERVGGMAFFTTLVDRFYEGVEHDPVLAPMYPADLTGPKKRLALFLSQYFGGPHDYDALRGHPRLRMRHMPFVIDQSAKRAWLRHMSAALARAQCSDEDRKELHAYFVSTAEFLVNHGGLSIVGR